MQRPAPDPVGPGQQSVWDYPRPPALVRSDRHVVVRCGDRLVAETRAAYRILETSHPPTWYLPLSSVVEGALTPSTFGTTFCEWKGAATYWDVYGIRAAAWSYEKPTPRYGAITAHLAFAASDLECAVDDERVRPQPGGFYAGWVTDDAVGPFKGVQGSWGW